MHPVGRQKQTRTIPIDPHDDGPKSFESFDELADEVPTARQDGRTWTVGAMPDSDRVNSFVRLLTTPSPRHVGFGASCACSATAATSAARITFAAIRHPDLSS